MELYTFCSIVKKSVVIYHTCSPCPDSARSKHSNEQLGASALSARLSSSPRAVRMLQRNSKAQVCNGSKLGRRQLSCSEFHVSCHARLSGAFPRSRRSWGRLALSAPESRHGALAEGMDSVAVRFPCSDTPESSISMDW